MGRLTECDKIGNWELKGVPWKDLNKGSVITDDILKKLYGALYKLMKYENTGLTPEKLVEIDEAYTQQAKELAEYKRADEQGLLLRLPCKVGDTVYHFVFIDDVVEIKEVKVARLSNLVAMMEDGDFGESVFLTREEAESKLEELRGGKSE